MCPLYPFHLILLYLCLLLPLLFAVVEGTEEIFGRWNITFIPKSVDKLQEYNNTEVQFNCYDCELPKGGYSDLQLSLISDNPGIAAVDYEQKADPDDFTQDEEILIDLEKYNFGNEKNWSFTFNVTGRFLGFTRVSAKVKKGKTGETVADLDTKLPISIARKKTIQSKMFSYSVALLISVAYINMGCAMDLQVVKETLRRPIGPAIGLICQFVIMPLLSFALGFIYPSPEMRLGLFVTGTSPGGGASNIWTVMFGGNLDLSVTMTAVSTFSAFFMMPLWIFSLGRVIFTDSDIIIPYYKICIYAFFLVVPLGIGLLISRYFPKVSKFLVRILKPMALFLILFIVIFGCWANLYIFKLMTWQVWLTGMGLPWLGFLFGWIMAMAFRRPYKDVIAIAIETGIQNTGMSIFILWFTLDHPLGDITAVVPVAAATMTPLPLLFGLTVMKLRSIFGKGETLVPIREEESPCPEDPNENGDGFKASESSAKLMPKQEVMMVPQH